MNKATLLKRLMQLTPTERLDIAEQLWDSVHPPGSIRPGEEFVLTDEQKAELDRRIAEHEAIRVRRFRGRSCELACEPSTVDEP